MTKAMNWKSQRANFNKEYRTLEISSEVKIELKF